MRKELFTAKQERLDAYKEKNAELPSKAKLHQAFPDDGVNIVEWQQVLQCFQRRLNGGKRSCRIPLKRRTSR